MGPRDGTCRPPVPQIFRPHAAGRAVSAVGDGGGPARRRGVSALRRRIRLLRRQPRRHRLLPKSRTGASGNVFRSFARMRVSCAVFRVAAPVVRGRGYLVGHAFVGGAHPAGARGLLAAEKLRTEFSLSGTYGKTRCMSVCVMQRVFSRWRIPAGTVPQGLVAARLLLVEEVHRPFDAHRDE